jgi:hypothetical protein
MRTGFFLGCCSFTFVCLAGCKGSAPPAPATRPARAATHPATRADARPAATVFTIDGLPTEFPHPILHVEPRDADAAVQLYSGDAASPQSPQANAYYFDMVLDEQDAADLNGAQWHFRATNRDRLDAPNGLFLGGDEIALQPFDVTVLFIQHGKQVTAELDGEFLSFSEQESAPVEKTVHVTGRLTVLPTQ